MSKVKRINHIDQEELKKSITYNPEDGTFTRNKTGKRVGSLTYSGNSCEKEYFQVCVCGKLYYAQRLAHLYMTGLWPSGDMDHIDGNGLNNSWTNLRVVTATENGKNQKLAKNNTSGLMGVSWRKLESTWGAYITSEKVRYHLGIYTDFFEACCARKSAENKFNFHKNHGKQDYV